MRPWLLILLLAAAPAWAKPSAKATPLSPTANVGLQAYCDKIAKAAESGAMKPRFFVDVAKSAKEPVQWKEFTDQASIDGACKDRPCVQQAWVYADKGQVMLAAFTFSSPQGEWVNNADYYFYLTGKIAKDRSELRSQHARDPQDPQAPPFLVEVVRSRYFNKAGKVIGTDKPLVYRVGEKSKTLIEGAQFSEGAWPQFKSTKDLPMAALLKAKKKEQP